MPRPPVIGAHGGLVFAETAEGEIVEVRRQIVAVEDVEHLHAELRLDALAPQRRVLQVRRIHVAETGSGDLLAAQITVAAEGRLGEAARVEPLRVEVVDRRAADLLCAGATMLPRSSYSPVPLLPLPERLLTVSPLLNLRTLFSSQTWVSTFAPCEPPGTSFGTVSLGRR
jgi:hypothetical protein